MNLINTIIIGGLLAIIVTIIEEWRMYRLKKRLNTAYSKLESLNFNYPQISKMIESIEHYKEK